MSRRVQLAAALLMIGAPASGHHTLTGIYARSQETTMQGIVREFRFVNPHPVLVIEVRPGSAEPEEWLLEMDNRRELERIGIVEDSLRRGDVVFVKGSLSLVRPQALYLWRLDRPVDGFWYEQRGSTPYTGFRE